MRLEGNRIPGSRFAEARFDWKLPIVVRILRVDVASAEHRARIFNIRSIGRQFGRSWSGPSRQLRPTAQLDYERIVSYVEIGQRTAFWDV